MKQRSSQAMNDLAAHLVVSLVLLLLGAVVARLALYFDRKE